MARHDNGFSLLEIMAVVTCLLILTGISVPNWLQSTWPIYRLKGAARQMIGDIRHAKMCAVTANSPYRIVISPKTNSYSIQKSVLLNGSPKWKIGFASKHPGALLPGELPKNIYIASVSVATLFVKPTGNISASTIILQNSNGQKVKIICSMAGRIRMERIV